MRISMSGTLVSNKCEIHTCLNEALQHFELLYIPDKIKEQSQS